VLRAEHVRQQRVLQRKQHLHGGWIDVPGSDRDVRERELRHMRRRRPALLRWRRWWQRNLQRAGLGVWSEQHVRRVRRGG
jgi:hypothetical protein